ncbi:MAG: LamG-like jellyroll fold domain-containing protein, partial [Planctomycetota bacterium]
MCKKLIFLTFFFTLVLGPAGGQAWGQRRAAYYDERYSESWTIDGASATVRDAFEDVGYEILDADQLKMFMDARIADRAPSVVVLCRDTAPDTVVESNSPDCTLRRYLDAGGKVVLYADVPFWYIAHSDGTRTRYKEAGCADILGISGTTYVDDWVNGDHGTVTITSEGAEWGLTETWTSWRWVPVDQVDIVLAEDNAGYASAWVKHFAPGDTTGGFVRIWDIWMDTDTIPNVEDIIRVAEYGLPSNPYNPVADLYDDGIVNIADFCILADYWNQSESSVDIAPLFGDGIVDFRDLAILTEYWLADFRLVAHWKLDETEGFIAHDSIGDKNATVAGAIWQPTGGKVGGALVFDGEYDLVSTDFVLNPAVGSFSVFAWIKGGEPGQVIISQTGSTGSAWLGADPSDGKLTTSLMDAFFPPLESESVITDGQWHHIGLVYDFEQFHRHLYVDGAEV